LSNQDDQDKSSFLKVIFEANLDNSEEDAAWVHNLAFRVYAVEKVIMFEKFGEEPSMIRNKEIGVFSVGKNFTPKMSV